MRLFYWSGVSRGENCVDPPGQDLTSPKVSREMSPKTGHQTFERNFSRAN